jgi:hypothetical protein
MHAGLKQPGINLAAIYEIRTREQVRIAVLYDGQWRTMLWFQVGKDGSVYAGPRLTNLTTVRWGSERPEGKPISIKYDDGEEVQDPELNRKAAKISFHASGIITGFGERARRAPLRNVRGVTQLCMILFQHPSQYPIIDKIKNRPGARDICLQYPIEERSPLIGSLSVGPLHERQIVRHARRMKEVCLVFEVIGVEGGCDLLLQLSLSHGPRGPWPPYTYLVFSATA